MWNVQFSPRRQRNFNVIHFVGEYGGSGELPFVDEPIGRCFSCWKQQFRVIHQVCETSSNILQLVLLSSSRLDEPHSVDVQPRCDCFDEIGNGFVCRFIHHQ